MTTNFPIADFFFEWRTPIVLDSNYPHLLIKSHNMWNELNQVCLQVEKWTKHFVCFLARDLSSKRSLENSIANANKLVCSRKVQFIRSDFVFLCSQANDLKRLDPAYGRDFERRINEVRQRLVCSYTRAKFVNDLDFFQENITGSVIHSPSSFDSDPENNVRENVVHDSIIVSHCRD